MSELSHYEKTGYLHDDFKIFHLKDTSMRPIDFHYHDFHKILIFRKGNISYNVEGRTYDLIPGISYSFPQVRSTVRFYTVLKFMSASSSIFPDTTWMPVMIPTISHSA